MSLLYKTLRFFDVKAEGGDGSEFSGYCAVFNNVDSYGDVILPGAFAKGLPDFLANGQICFNHEEVIGKPLEAHEDAKGLFVRGKISDTAKGRDCKTLLKDGVMRKMSIGYRALAKKRANAVELNEYWKAIGYQPGPEDLSNVAQNADYLNFLNEIKLYEASPVGFPANVQADITGVKNAVRLDRVKALVAAQLKSGRTLSKATHAYLSAVHGAMDPAMKDLKALLDQHDPDTLEGDEDEVDVEGTLSNGGADKPPTKPKKSAALAKARAELLILSAHPSLVRV